VLGVSIVGEVENGERERGKGNGGKGRGGDEMNGANDMERQKTAHLDDFQNKRLELRG